MATFSIGGWRRLPWLAATICLGTAAGCGDSPPLSEVQMISAGGRFVCALQDDRTVKCWGVNDDGQLGNGSTASSPKPVPIGGLTDVMAISAGWNHACAVLVSGEVRCWGRGYTAVPMAIEGVTGAVAVSAGASTREVDSCALLADGTVTCWSFFTGPTLVDGLTNVAAISLGHYQACAATAAGAVACWGPDVDAITRSPAESLRTPVPVPGLAGAVAIASGVSDDCALVVGGFVQCWLTTRPPTVVEGLTNVVELAAPRGSHTCAVRAGGDVVCWGTNVSGELGDGTKTNSAFPVAVRNLSGAKAISVGVEFSCALVANGGVKCWGSNARGSLGNGTMTDSPLPTAVSAP